MKTVVMAATVAKFVNGSSTTQRSLTLMSYNMHGLNQGRSTVIDFRDCVDIFMLQEHWQTPANMTRFGQLFPDYCAFGVFALEERVQAGPLIGRPYGGVVTLIRNELLSECECLYTAERLVVVRISNILLCNVYLPCTGTLDRDLVCEDVIAQVLAWRAKFPDYGWILAGDFNSVLSDNSTISRLVNKFLLDNNLVRCDLLFPCQPDYTFVNEAQRQYSKLDYVTFCDMKISSFMVHDSVTNLSDHLPISIVFECAISLSKDCRDKQPTVKRLRWDHADISGYYYSTELYLQPILSELCQFELGSGSDLSGRASQLIECVYESIVFALQDSASKYVPTHQVNFYKFWWSQELSCLKEKAIISDRLWKDAGRPRSGPLFSRRSSDKRAYKSAIRKQESDSEGRYTNELNDALLLKRGNEFWKCWNSKFSTGAGQCKQVDGLTDHQQIADNFEKHFAALGSVVQNNAIRNMQCTYEHIRPNYVGSPYLQEQRFDAELVSNVIIDLKRGKAAGLDTLTAEHLQNSHCLLPAVLAKLFNLMILHGYVPGSWGLSYTVPLLKDKNSCKSLKSDDFRGISISCVISKVFEHCVLGRFSTFLATTDSQFGFKKATGCPHAIFTARSVVSQYTLGGSTVNLAALDISKAFDRVDHSGLFVKLMNRRVPNVLLSTLENWFAKCYTCVRWRSAWSSFFRIKCGVRQGGVLSPQLFAVYIDDAIKAVQSVGSGCYMRHVCINIIVYADDILLLSPSVEGLQQIVTVCEIVINSLGLDLNYRKSVCMRMGPRYLVQCVNIKTINGNVLDWVSELRYLGVFLVSSSKFKCNYAYAKKSFYRSFNAIFGRVGRRVNEDVVLHLVKAKCLPVLLYGLEVCPVNVSDMRSLEFTVKRIMIKLFCTYDSGIINSCMSFFGLPTVNELVEQRKNRFILKCSLLDNLLCKVCQSQ